MSVEPIAPFLEPLRKEVVLPLPPERAFALFTAGVGLWWPLAAHSVGQARAASCAIEPRVGGAWVETLDDGTRHVWGTVVVWDPPRRLVTTWHPGRAAETAQEIEVRFVAAGDGTRVELEHRNWQRLGVTAAATRRGYETGWDGVLARLAGAA